MQICTGCMSAYVHVFHTKIQSDACRYELLPRVHICMYLHVCGLNISDIQTHMHRIQSIGKRDTGTYKRIQQCAYDICTVYIGYALDCIMCICACISVCIFFRYIQDISVHIRVVSVCIFGRYAHAGSLMTRDDWAKKRVSASWSSGAASGTHRSGTPPGERKRGVANTRPSAEKWPPGMSAKK